MFAEYIGSQLGQNSGSEVFCIFYCSRLCSWSSRCENLFLGPIKKILFASIVLITPLPSTNVFVITLCVHVCNNCLLYLICVCTVAIYSVSFYQCLTLANLTYSKI